MAKQSECLGKGCTIITDVFKLLTNHGKCILLRIIPMYDSDNEIRPIIIIIIVFIDLRKCKSKLEVNNRCIVQKNYERV